MHQSDTIAQVTSLIRNLFLAVGFVLFVYVTLAVGQAIMATNPTAAPATDLQPELKTVLDKR